jgi:uncharacterized protein YwgA
MSQSNKLVYSDDPCSAFMAAIVRAYEQQVGGRHYLGRTAMQKLVYFAKVLGVPIPCSFEIYTYGPYSDVLTFSVDSMVADDVLKDTSNDPHAYSNYRLGENAEEILQRYQDLIEPYRGKIDAVVRSLGKFKPQELELIATLHFIHHRLKQIWRKEPSKAQVLEEFRRTKKDKFTDPDIESFYNALKNAKLI